MATGNTIRGPLNPFRVELVRGLSVKEAVYHWIIPYYARPYGGKQMNRCGRSLLQSKMVGSDICTTAPRINPLGLKKIKERKVFRSEWCCCRSGLHAHGGRWWPKMKPTYIKWFLKPVQGPNARESRAFTTSKGATVWYHRTGYTPYHGGGERFRDIIAPKRSFSSGLRVLEYHFAILRHQICVMRIIKVRSQLKNWIL